MKLRTKIILICITIIITASFIVDFSIYRLQKNSYMENAETEAYQEAFVAFSKYESEFGRFTAQDTTDSRLAYFFKKMNDDYIICFRVDKSVINYSEVYNHTVFSAVELEKPDFKTNRYDGISMESAYMERGNGHYIVYKCNQNDVILYKLCDISYIWRDLRQLVIYMLAVTLGVTIAACAALYIFMRHAFSPLDTLSENAGDIADGHYDNRVTIKGHDEIAGLGESFNRMAEAVSEREKSKTLLMANLTHELKTPMAAISGYAETLLSVKLSEEDYTEALSYINEECGRLSKLSKKMMRLLELDGDGGLELGDVSVNDIFECAIRTLKNAISAKDIKLTVECGDVHIRADGELVCEAVINLLDNAVKASADGGRIELTADKDRITVRDYGLGISGEELVKIREPFYMADKSRSRKSGGAGLGLAIVSLIAERHNASLIIDSEVGSGTSVILQFV